MFCTQCGAKLASDAKFCVGCGTRVLSGSPEGGPSSPATVEASRTPSTQGTLIGAFANHRQPLTGRQIAGALFGVIGLGAIGAAFLSAYTGQNTAQANDGSPTVYHCGDPIIIEECGVGSIDLPDCRIRNVAEVQLGEIGAWAYDKQGTRVGSPVVQTPLTGLQPGKAIKLEVTAGVESFHDVATIVLCSVDPESAVGHRRFGIGQSPLTR